MSRDHVVSIRLTTEERDRLAKRGRVSDVVRDLIRRALEPPLPPGQSVGYRPPEVAWFDGTASNTWPEVATRVS